jgi:hypothetical protein
VRGAQRVKPVGQHDTPRYLSANQFGVGKGAREQKGFSFMCESEVARLRRQIELEIEAMQRGMNGFAFGLARHSFIRKRMDRVGTYQEKLMRTIGEDEATKMVYGIYAKAVD